MLDKFMTIIHYKQCPSTAVPQVWNTNMFKTIPRAW